MSTESWASATTTLTTLPADLVALDTQALLLRGPAGSQATTIALTLAQWRLCQARLAQAPCGQCQACHLWQVKTHPDLRILAPETWFIAQDWPLPAEAQKQIDSKARKPSRKTGIDAVRDVTEFAHITATHAAGKIVLVVQAEHMTLEAANALLKVLEEPPADMRFILASEAAHALLPTIVSRCNSFTLPWLAQSQRCSEAERVVPQRLAQGDSLAFEGLSPAAAVTLCQKLCHDLARRTCGAGPVYFATSDLPQAPGLMLLVRWHKLLQDMQRHIEHPWREALLLENLAVQSSRILRA